MKTLLCFLSVFYAALAFSQSVVSDQWLVILSGFKAEADAHSDAETYTYKTQVLSSSDYTNLNPGWYIVAIPYVSEAAAKARSAALNKTGLKSYVKYSGANKTVSVDVFAQDYFLVYGGKYVLFNFPVEDKQGLKAELIGSELHDDVYLARAKVNKSRLPEKYLKMDGRFVRLYDKNGNQRTAQIMDFNLARIHSPHWGRMQQWSTDGTSTYDIGKELLDGCYGCTLVGVLNVGDDFNGLFCHMNTNEIFQPFKKSKNEALEAQVKTRSKQLAGYMQYSALLDSAVQASGMTADPNYIGHTITAFEYNNQTYLLQRVEFGDFCEYIRDAFMYKVLYYVWRTELGSVVLVDTYKGDFGLDVFPLFEAGTQKLKGICSGDPYKRDLWLKADQWGNEKTFEVSANLCD